MKLEGRVAIVTGGGQGMGSAVSETFAREGAAVAVVDINEATAQDVAASISRDGGSARAFRCDVSQPSSVREMVTAVVGAFGRVDILYDNAARLKSAPPVSEAVADMAEEHWQAVLDVNLTGIYLCAKYALHEMLQQGSGVIVNVSSTAGLVAAGGHAAYGTSKAGILALTRSMAKDYARQGIRVNAICPGPIDTPRFRGTQDPERGSGDDRVRLRGAEVPMGRIGTADDVAKVALFFASDDSAFVTGAHLVVDGGATL